MIRELLVCGTDNLIPYRNLALEEYLMDTVPKDACTLYLWQNRNTVVIGRNQNCWKECRVKELEADGGFVVRRLSGGGAVYHDLGNLNFTFLVRKEDYDVARQLEVILRAVSSLGIGAEKSGRNDITVDGKKFSGNAFYFNGDRAYHHGTLMIGVDKNKVAKYLNVSADKIRSKGVDSVRSRVTNLMDYRPDLSVALMKQKLAEAFGEVYGCKPTFLSETEIDPEELEARRKKFASPDWIYGKDMPFQAEISRRFAWGGVDLRLRAENRTVTDAQVFSDAMDEAFITRIPSLLRGCPFSSGVMASRVRAAFSEDPVRSDFAKDIAQLLTEQSF